MKASAIVSMKQLITQKLYNIMRRETDTESSMFIWKLMIGPHILAFVS